MGFREGGQPPLQRILVFKYPSRDRVNAILNNDWFFSAVNKIWNVLNLKKICGATKTDQIVWLCSKQICFSDPQDLKIFSDCHGKYNYINKHILLCHCDYALHCALCKAYTKTCDARLFNTKSTFNTITKELKWQL